DLHAHTAYDGHRLQPPRDGAEHKVVGADERIKKNLRPECQDTQTIGIDGPVQLLGQEIIDHPQHEQHKPHPYSLMHVIPLDDGFAQPLLPPRDVSHNGDDQGKNHRGYDVPIGDINVMGGPLRYRFKVIDERKHQADAEQQHDGPNILAILATAVVDTCHER